MKDVKKKAPSLAEAVFLHLGMEGENSAVQERFLKSSWFPFSWWKGKGAGQGESSG